MAFRKVGMFRQQQKELSMHGTAVYANAVEVLKIWNLTISFHFLVAAVPKPLIFNSFVCLATAVNQIVASVKSTING